MILPHPYQALRVVRVVQLVHFSLALAGMHSVVSAAIFMVIRLTEVAELSFLKQRLVA